MNIFFVFPKTGLRTNWLLALGFFLLGLPMIWANTYTVINTDDDGAGSLRQAITDANLNPGADVIDFSVAGTVTLLSDLPTISDALTIDGTSAPGYVIGAPTFMLDGAVTVFSASEPTGLTVQGMALVNSGAQGGTGFDLYASSGDVFIKNCKISNWRTGISCHGEANWVVRDNDLTATYFALSFQGVTTGDITAHDNLFGGANSGDGLRLFDCADKVIGDENASPAADILIKDTDGMTTVRENAIYAVNCADLIFDNLDLSNDIDPMTLGGNGLAFGLGLTTVNSSGSIIVRNCRIESRYNSLVCDGNANWTVTNNDLASLYTWNCLSFKGVNTGSIVASDNQFTDAQAGLILTDCADKIIGGENASPAADILIKEADGLTAVYQSPIGTFNCSDLTFDNIDASASNAYAGGGIVLQGSAGAMVVKNCQVHSRGGVAVSCGGNANWVVTNNDLTYNGRCLAFSGVITGTISAYDNLLGASEVGLSLNECANKVIGDENASPAADILIKDTDGLTNSGSWVVSAVAAQHCSNLVFDNLDLSSASSSVSGNGMIVFYPTGPITIKNCTMRNRQTALSCQGDAVWEVTDNDLSASALAMFLVGITTGTFTATDNVFGGQGAVDGFFLYQCSNFIVGDENTTPAANLLIKDTEGLRSIPGTVFSVSDCSNLIFDNLDLSNETGSDYGTGIGMYGSSGTTTVQNCIIDQRNTGLILDGNTSNSLISCNIITNCQTGMSTSGEHVDHSIVNNVFEGNTNSIQQSGTPLVAQSNYWGGIAPTNGGFNGYTGSVDVSNHLTSPPACTPFTCADTDNDGICDSEDNCPNTANADQADSDGNGIGNACETGCAHDADNDAICDEDDNCDNAPNPSQADADCDGVGNACDQCPSGNDAVDNNHDGIADCNQLLAYEAYSPDWKCGNNKIKVCHNGNTTCINKNALSAHFNHGDKVGPCIGCNGRPSGDRAEFAEAMGLEVVPNPASDEAIVYFDDLDTKAMLTITDQLGKLIWTTALAKDQTEITLDLSDGRFSSGVYFVSVRTENQMLTQRLIITK
ncbi:MAG: T9SS type A sorting domain-containing protein [Phycisphaerae bacterium]|nr:T9SS type A sorting domain-containing protein [Saprospiraceae bacterium]